MTGSLFRGASSPPQATAEFWRVAQIPRRAYSAAEQEQIRQSMTATLRRPEGKGELWVTQAVSLFDLSFAGGLVGSIPVGLGKTLTSLLAPTVWQRVRPLLLVPAALVDKTKRAYRELSAHWRINPSIRIKSYEWLGRVGAKRFLDEWLPDIIVTDESHYLANPSAGVTRRVVRYLRAHKDCIFVALSGTITKRSIKDYAHLVELAYARNPINTPIPLSFHDLMSWADVLDEGGGGSNPGVLTHLCTDEERKTGIRGVRSAFRRRLTETLGFVQINGGDGEVDIPIVIETPELDPPLPVQRALNQMRADWATPDGTEFLSAIELWRHCRELALGFYYRWTVPPPPPWAEARKAWAKAARWIIESGRKHVDTVLDATHAIDKGLYPEYAETLEAWRNVRDSFEPATEAVWVSPHVIEWVESYLTTHHKATPHLIWVEHRAMGEALSRRTGLRFYAPDDHTGRSILDHPQRESAILSWHACRTGFDLPWASRNVIISPLTSGRGIEQLLGRTHRRGQKADVVNVIIPVWCEEHYKAIEQSRADAAYIEATLGASQKLLKADWA